jgi:hypothetical protein
MEMITMDAYNTIDGYLNAAHLGFNEWKDSLFSIVCKRTVFDNVLAT